MISVLVVIPTYNESESIQSLLSRLDAARKVVSEMFSIDILLVDDVGVIETLNPVTSVKTP